MGLIQTLLGPIEALFDRIFAGTVVSKLAHKISEGVGHFTTLFARIEKLISSIKDEIAGFSNWQEDIRFKSRVISLPAAVTKARDLVTGLRDAWQAILGLIDDFKSALRGGDDPAADAEEIAADAASLENVGAKLLARLPKLGKLFERLLGVVTLLVDTLIVWSDAVDKLQTIVDEVSRIRLAVEKLDTIFLSQSNARRSLKLADGKVLKIRVGNLHR